MNDLENLIRTCNTFNAERHPGEPAFRIPDELRRVIEYAAESECVEGTPPDSVSDCECVACGARQLLQDLWPEPKSSDTLAPAGGLDG